MSRPFDDPAVEAVFDAYPSDLRADLLRLRALILETASEIEAVGPLVESLKWGQPAYRPTKPKSGTTLRIGAVKNDPGRYAMFFHCQTTLADTFRQIYGDQLVFQGDRAILFSHGDAIPRDALKHCIALALTYHARPKHRVR
ncbi:MAG: DUF1801 domain-containing protein [Alphaproteobacteria bacterium]|nr:DUF1801 domain-containing protein [Alphaproteobacteria bacterium]